MLPYIAHVNEETNEIQTIKGHSENTASLCRAFSIPPLKNLMYDIGLFHDVGKYQETFQNKIHGENVRIEHSICGAQVAGNKYKGALGLMMEYCIAGHHSGIPDGGFKFETEE